MKKIIAVFTSLALLSACAPKPGQNQYYAGEVGQATEVEYERVVAVKKVKIQNESTGLGAGGGAVAGGVAGAQFGNGDGKAAAVIVGAIIGALAGAAAEQELQNQVGYQYTVVTRNKKTKTIVQNQNSDDVVFRKGDRVIIQTQGNFHRVMATDDLPEEIRNAKEIKVRD